MAQIETSPNEQFADADAARGSRGFLFIIWQRKALVVLGTVIGLIVGALVYWQRPSVYKADAQVHVIKKNTPLGNPNAAQFTPVEDYMATHAVVLKSHYIAERAIKKKDLGSLKSFEGDGDPIGTMVNSFTVVRDKEAGGSILLLSYRGPVADDCPKILSAIIDAYQDYLNDKYNITTDQTLDLIQKARDNLWNELSKAEKAHLKFRERTRIFVLNEKTINVQIEGIINLQKTRTNKMVLLGELKDRIALLERAVVDGNGPEVLSIIARGTGVGADSLNPNKAMDDELLPWRVKLQELLVTNGENSDAVKAVRVRIALTEEHYKKSTADMEKLEKDPVKRTLKVLKVLLHETELNVKTHDLLLEKATVLAQDSGTLEVEEEHMRGDVARARELHKVTVDRLAQLNLMRNSIGFDTQKLSQSSGYKVAPNAFQMIVAGLMVGLLAGIGLAFLADLTDKSFRNPDEVRVRLGLPLLGHVPFLQADPDAAKRAKAGEISVDPMLLSLYRPKSLEAEAYRAIRTSLYFSVQGEGHRVLQVSSPNKGDGKSLMVSNLAISMAQSGKKVLVIDADCRRPRQHKIFNLSNSQGLTSVLANGADWKSSIYVTPVDGLWIMPSGPIPPNPSELLSSPRFVELLETARPEFDYVLVDTPPLLAVTDPCVVAGHVDGLVLILRLSRQGRPHAERARQILNSLGVKILGVVVNGVARQGGTGIYSSEHYDYTESYEQAPEADDNDGYYYHEEEKTPEPPAKK